MRRLVFGCLVALVGCRTAPEATPVPAAALPPPVVASSANAAPDARAPALVTATFASDAGAPAAAPAFPPLPEGATVMVFRDLLAGALPYPSTRHTWTLATTNDKVVLRLVEEKAVKSFEHLDATTEPAAGWKDAVLTAWEGPRPSTRPLSNVELGLVYGPARTSPPDPHRPRAEPARALRITCTMQSIRVHPAGAALHPGHKRNDDTMTRATWVPAGVETVNGVTSCTLDPSLLLSFTTSLAFAPARTGTKASAGVEWAFDNGDMTIQEGGYRFIPGP